MRFICMYKNVVVNLYIELIDILWIEKNLVNCLSNIDRGLG